VRVSKLKLAKASLFTMAQNYCRAPLLPQVHDKSDCDLRDFPCLNRPNGELQATALRAPAMTAWAVSLLNSPVAYPIFSTANRRFGSDNVMARIEWHPWTYRNGIKVTGQFRGVTLYEVLTPATSLVEGIDVSWYQKDIDWKQVANSKVFAFIKATEGTSHEDKSFATNWNNARKAGLLCGTYHFFRPGVDAIRQAEFFLSRVNACELPPVLDVETSDDVAGATLAHGVNTWVEHVAGRLRRPLVYSSPSFWQKLPTTDIEQKADLWIAEWECKHPVKVGNWPGPSRLG
jgi:GH25 family lysozyme M1 (1,4-beta-N-acetylmuramidase)